MGIWRCQRIGEIYLGPTNEYNMSDEYMLYNMDSDEKGAWVQLP